MYVRLIGPIYIFVRAFYRWAIEDLRGEQVAAYKLTQYIDLLSFLGLLWMGL